MFKFRKGDGKDTITDFEIGRDVIDIAGLKRLNQLDFDRQGDDVTISYRNIDILVRDVTLNALQDAGNFDL